MNDLAVEYFKQWKKWREDLKPYWKQIDLNQEMYEFYKSEDEESESAVSLNTPSSIIEGMIAKGNETNLIVDIKAKGENGARDWNEWVSAIVKDAILDPDVEAIKGSFRKIKESYEREFYVKGNAFAECNWLKDVKAPFVRVLSYKSVIFNPAKTAANSDIYYIEKYSSFKSLKESGLYTNLSKLKEKSAEEGKIIDHEDEQLIASGNKVARKVESIQLLERWEGSHLIVIADGTTVIRDVVDPFKIKRHPLLISMNYVIVGRPYAYGEIDYIYKSVRAQDTVVNQNIQIINRYLRDALIVDRDSNMDLDALTAVLENGGMMVGKTDAIKPIPTNTPPQQAFMSIDILQQAIERAARYSPYSQGVPNQETDKTAGTMGGIKALQTASEPNFQIKLDTIQDSFMKPLARIYLQMLGNLMGSTDMRYALMKNKNPEWVSASRNILKGKATLKDMFISGMLTQKEALQAGVELAKNGKDPNTHLMFDVDWLVDVRLDNQSQVDKTQKTQNKMAWIVWSQQNLGVQFSGEKTATEIGRDTGIDNPEDLYLSEEEKAQMEQEQQSQMQMQQQSQQSELEQRAKEKMMDIQSKQGLEKMKQEGQMKMAAMKQPPIGGV